MIVSSVRRRFEPGELDVLKAVEGEPRRPGFLASARADVGVGDAGLAEVGGVDRAVGVEPLGEPQGDLLARLALEPSAWTTPAKFWPRSRRRRRVSAR